MSQIPPGIGRARWEATISLVQRRSQPLPRTVEFGATDASFRTALEHSSWTTVDKYGQPDVLAELDGTDCRIPLPDGCADLVLCTEVLEHLRAGSQLVTEMARLLAPDGLAVVSVPNAASLKARVLVPAGRLPANAASGDCGPDLGGTGIWDGRGWVAAHVVDYNLARLKSYLKRGGLEVVEAAPMALTVAVRGNERVLLPWIPAQLADHIVVAAQRATD